MSDTALPASRARQEAAAATTSDAKTSRSVSAIAKTDSIAAWLHAVAALLWIPQAGLIAFVIGKIASGGGVRDALWPAVGFLILGLIRTVTEALASRRAFLS